MATSHYFNNYGSTNEQRVIEDLIVESIKIMGFDAYYLANTNDQARDLLYGEDPLKKFTTAFQLELYLSNSTEYMGEKEFFSKFGLEIKNNVNVIVSKRTFTQRVPQNTFTRPREGDLIYIPFLNGTGEIFEIKFTNQTKDFFMLGRKVPYFYELELEKFKFSNEVIQTGKPDIDVIVARDSYTLTLNTGAGSGTFLIPEIVFQSTDNTFANATSSATVQSWIPKSNALTVSNIIGDFVDGKTIRGQTSNAHYILTSFNPLQSASPNDQYDNNFISTQGISITDFSESNPFGSI